MIYSRIGIIYSIQSNESGPGHSSHKSKGQDCQPRREAQMEDSRTSTSYQRVASTFDTLIESPEADITSITIFRPEPFSTCNNINIKVSVQELVYCGKAAVVGTSAKSLDRHNELISSNEEVHGPEKTEDLLRGWTPISCKGQFQKIKAWLKPKHVFRGTEEEVGPRKGQQPSGTSPSLQKQRFASISAKKGKESPKEKSEGQ
ncbi:hypothetical protein O181_037069 [Austropuccinia psidii MF-1]|uniref:Uncharacterized protein n=1 Tax=Austropuccinia psidii MF-1 TaxID=1389203 RepID=A0A9Q3D5U7_9BASI|nr:hypothetical protein [Austropuccinia psidii MF-1]